jgi:hypothetical protein
MTLDSFRDSVRQARGTNGQVWINPDDAAEILTEAGLLPPSSMIDGLIIHRDPTKVRGELEFHP